MFNFFADQCIASVTRQFAAPYRESILGKKDAAKFVVIGHARSGTRMLCDILNNHPHVVCHTECFSARFIGHRGLWDLFCDENPNLRQRLQKKYILGLRRRYYRQFEAEVLLHPVTPDIKAIGYKLLSNQINDHIARMLIEEKRKIVYIERQDKLRAAVSLYRARQTGQFHPAQKNQVKLHVDVHTVYGIYRGFYRQMKRVKHMFKDLPAISLIYEDLCANPETKERLAAFLEISPQLGGANTIKLEERPLDQFILNYDELMAEVERHHLDG